VAAADLNDPLVNLGETDERLLLANEFAVGSPAINEMQHWLLQARRSAASGALRVVAMCRWLMAVEFLASRPTGRVHACIQVKTRSPAYIYALRVSRELKSVGDRVFLVLR
jgi:hypothetical protein